MPLELKEADIQRTCIDWMELHGWRHLRTDPVSDRKRGKGFGEIGMADSLFLHYRMAEILWVEWKREGGKPTQAQSKWHAAERARGALICVLGIDCETSIEGFQEWCFVNGLAWRRK